VPTVMNRSVKPSRRATSCKRRFPYLLVVCRRIPMTCEDPVTLDTPLDVNVMPPGARDPAYVEDDQLTSKTTNSSGTSTITQSGWSRPWQSLPLSGGVMAGGHSRQTVRLGEMMTGVRAGPAG
jgi:hypothetical protein